MDIVVTGAGICGLTTAMLASDGHEVTVLERDPAPAPDPDKAWDDWERRGVNQFRLPHFFGRASDRSSNPNSQCSACARGCRNASLQLHGPDPRRDDRRQEAGTTSTPSSRAGVASSSRWSPLCRRVRPLDSAPCHCSRGSGCWGQSHWGRSPTGPGATGAGASGAVPHVTGVKTETGEIFAADLVVDATGRRSSLPRWLTEIGAREPKRSSRTAGSPTTADTSVRKTAPFLFPSDRRCRSTARSPCYYFPLTTRPGRRPSWRAHATRQ